MTKETTTLSRRRSYDDGCATAHALDLIGERWALLVVRELMFGPKRFTDLRTGLHGISPNVLAQRLEDLEAAGILQRAKLPPPAASSVYALTEWGRDLEPVFQAIGRWAVRSPNLPLDKRMGAASLLLSLRTMIDRQEARWARGRIGLKLGDEGFVATLSHGEIDIAPGDPAAADVSIAADPNALAAVIYGGRPLREAVEAGDVSVSGDGALAERFVGLFPMKS